MTPRARLIALAVPLSVLAACVSPARAEVYAIPDPAGYGAELRIVPAGAEGRQPWTPMGLAADPAFLLNPGGDGFGDEAPVAAFDPISRLPFVAWASRTPGGDRDVHVAAFDGAGWTDLGTARREGTRDDVSPALVIVDGVPFLAWVERGRNSSVWYSVYSAWAGWSAPVQASPAEGAWLAPSLLLTNSEIVLGFTSRSKNAKVAVQMIAIPRNGTAGVLATDGPMPVPPGVQPPDGGGGSNINP